MAFPTVAGSAETAVTTAGTSHAITLPASIAATDVVLVLMDIGSTLASLNALANWSEVLDEAAANGLKILSYTGTGVPSSPTFVSTAATRSASIALRISGASRSVTPQIATTGTGTSATPDPPSVTPTGDVAWVGSATGEAPLTGVSDGTAEGTVTWAGAATGTSVYSGAATGSVTWTGTATGVAAAVVYIPAPERTRMIAADRRTVTVQPPRATPVTDERTGAIQSDNRTLEVR